MRTSVIAYASLLFLGASAALWSASPARAFVESRPARACEALADRQDVSGLWLGHFTGGGLTKTPDGARALAWRDEFSCFTSASACAAWQKNFRKTYADQEGYRTCLPLRRGGTLIRD